ncbi:MAG: MotA/TolQ/ExbB proton channel family protein [Acidobacteria bacterium]|nr:MotA/TolQ/ExbB proton channel family protein [Acidobacteriota bacterium]
MQAIPETVGLDGGVLQLVLQSGPVVKGVLLSLILFSVFSWAVIAERHRLYKTVQRRNERVVRALRQVSRLSDLRSLLESLPASPFAGLLRMAASEIRSLAQSQTVVHVPADTTDLERALRQAIVEESGGLERRLGFLATTGSVSPFIGLFGTVWGIMHAFRGIGAAGSASLATVAPGISEALVATAAGLAAAIPAVMAYNYFLARVRGIRNGMEGFALEVLRWGSRVARASAVPAREER